MTDEGRGIQVAGVDRDAIRVSLDKKEFWVVLFNLSQEPDQAWQRKFYEVQQDDGNLLKRKARFVEGGIELDISEADNLQDILDVLKSEVEQTNIQCEEDFQKKARIREELEALQKRQRDATEKLKGDSDNLVF